MSVVVETTLGDITIDLFVKQRPRACLNFLKLCKMKYYNYNLFHTISRGFIAQTGDPTGTRNGGESIFGVLDGPSRRYFEAEKNPRIKHTTLGLVSFVGDNQMIGSQFFLTLGTDLSYLDEQHCVFGEVMEGLDVLELLNEAICDQDNRPYQDVRVTHTVVLDDPFPDPERLTVPERSPSPSAERMQGGRLAPDEEIDETEGRTAEEVGEIVADREAKARATILEMVGDIPDAEMAPPENVLFVCKLNPVTTDDDLEIIFSRFGKIKSCEVIRDKKTGDSLQYAFVEFHDRKSCEDAYFKMDNVLIDDRRIHVDFSQSVAKVRWHGKGRGVTTYDETGRRSNDAKNDIGNGKYKQRNGDHKYGRKQENSSDRSGENRRAYSDRERRYVGHPRDQRNNYEVRRRDSAADKSYRNERRDRRERSTERSRNGRNRSVERDSRYKSERHRRVDSGRKEDRRTGSSYKNDGRRADHSSDENARHRKVRKEKHCGTKKGKRSSSSDDDSSSSSSTSAEDEQKEKKKPKHKRRGEDENERKQKKKHRKKKYDSSDDS